MDIYRHKETSSRIVIHVSLRNSSDLLRDRMIDRLPLIRDRGVLEKVDEITRDTSGN